MLPGLLQSWLLAAVRGGNTQPLSPTPSPTHLGLHTPGNATADAMDIDTCKAISPKASMTGKTAPHNLRGNLTAPAAKSTVTTTSLPDMSCSKAVESFTEPLASAGSDSSVSPTSAEPTGVSPTPLPAVLLAPPMLLALGVVLALGPANCLA